MRPSDEQAASTAARDAEGPDRALLARLLDLGRIGVAVFGADKRIGWAAGRMPGTYGTGAVGMTCAELFSRTDAPCEPCALEASAREGPQRRTLHAESAEGVAGALYEVVVAPRSVTDAGGGFVLLSREIGGQEGLASFLGSAAFDVAQMIDAWSVPVVMLDAKEAVRGWNLGARKLYGHDGDAVLGATWPGVVEEDEVVDLTHVASTRTRRYEARHRRADGARVDVMVTRTDLRGGDGAAEGAFVLVVDLTESKALERRLARRVAQLSIIREIAENLQSAMDLARILRTILVGATAAQGLRFNRAFLVLVDEKRGILVGRDAVGPADPAEAHRIGSELAGQNASLKDLLRRIEPLLEGGGGRVLDIARSLRARLEDADGFLVRTLRAPGSVRIRDGVEAGTGRAVDAAVLEALGVRDFVAVPLRTESEPLGLLIADNSITGRPVADEDVAVLEHLGLQASVAIERARLTDALARQVDSLERATVELRTNQERLVRYERLSAIGEMAARVAHEIRNPLVAIGGFARSLQREVAEGDPKRESLDIIVDEVRRLEGIVREVLDFSRPSPPRIAPVRLDRLAQEVAELMRTELDAASVRCHVEAPEDLPMAAADRDQIYQVLVNVVGNALHAMPRGGELTIRLRSIPGAIELSVRDTGVGMSSDVRAKIFEPFFTTKPSGSGLGLTIAAQIIRDHNGEIRVESREGEGTIVILRIPTAGEEGERAQDPVGRG